MYMLNKLPIFQKNANLEVLLYFISHKLQRLSTLMLIWVIFDFFHIGNMKKRPNCIWILTESSAKRF